MSRILRGSRKESSATPADIIGWRRRLKLSTQRAADALGIGRITMSLYEKGEREKGRKVKIPLVVALACSAVEKRLKPLGSYQPKPDTDDKTSKGTSKGTSNVWP